MVADNLCKHDQKFDDTQFSKELDDNKIGKTDTILRMLTVNRQFLDKY